MKWFRRSDNKTRRIRRLELEHDRLSNDYKFASNFFMGHVRGPRVRARLSERMRQIEAEIEELERDD